MKTENLKVHKSKIAGDDCSNGKNNINKPIKLTKIHIINIYFSKYDVNS